MNKNFEHILQDIRNRKELTKGSLHEEMLDLELADIKEVLCKPIREVLSDEEYQRLDQRTILGLQMKECYSNSLHVAQALSAIRDDVRYVEGYALAANVLPIPHAWVKVGEDYIDPTFELVLKKDVRVETYAALGEYTYDYALSRMAEWGTYGDVYMQDNLRKIKNNR